MQFKVQIIPQLFQLFWKPRPALHAGLLIFLGCAFSFENGWALVPAFLLFLSAKNKLLGCLFFLGIFYVSLFHQFPSERGVGTGIIRVHRVLPAKRGGWSYRATLEKFVREGTSKTCARNIPCTLFSKERYSLESRYAVHGVLKKGKWYSLKTKEQWVPYSSRYTLAEVRLRLKEKVCRYIENKIPDSRVAAFLAGLSTGEITDPLMMKEFGQLGLSHIMAISGFHFALIALFFHFFLRLLLPSRINALLLSILLTGYFIFVGYGPSIERAWVASLTFFLGLFFQKRSDPLNNLGLALIAGILVDPLVCKNLGFQLSFLATAGILLLYSPVESALRNLFPKRHFFEVHTRSFRFQYLYILRSLFREALALCLAVHLALVPLLLFHFHKFPLHSLFYNLFFPFLVSLSLLFFLFTLPFDLFLKPLGNLLHELNSYYTQAILTLTEVPPFTFRTVYVESFSSTMVMAFLTLLFGGTILSQQWREYKLNNTLE